MRRPRAVARVERWRGMIRRRQASVTGRAGVQAPRFLCPMIARMIEANTAMVMGDGASSALLAAGGFATITFLPGLGRHLCASLSTRAHFGWREDKAAR